MSVRKWLTEAPAATLQDERLHANRHGDAQSNRSTRVAQADPREKGVRQLLPPAAPATASTPVRGLAAPPARDRRPKVGWDTYAGGSTPYCPQARQPRAQIWSNDLSFRELSMNAKNNYAGLPPISGPARSTKGGKKAGNTASTSSARSTSNPATLPNIYSSAGGRGTVALALEGNKKYGKGAKLMAEANDIAGQLQTLTAQRDKLHERAVRSQAKGLAETQTQLRAIAEKIKVPGMPNLPGQVSAWQAENDCGGKYRRQHLLDIAKRLSNNEEPFPQSGPKNRVYEFVSMTPGIEVLYMTNLSDEMTQVELEKLCVELGIDPALMYKWDKSDKSCS